MKKVFQFTTLQGKILFYFFLVSIIALLITFALVYYQVTGDIRNQETDKLIAIRDLKVNQLNSWLAERKGDIRVIASDYEIRSVEFLLLNNERPEVEKMNLLEGARQLLQRYIKNYSHYQELLIIQPETGKIILSTIEQHEGTDVSERAYFQIPLKSGGIAIQEIRYSEYLKKPTLDFSIPVYCLEHQGNHIIGILVARVDPNVSLYPLLSNTIGLGETGETLIINRDRITQNPLRWQKDAALRLKINATPAGQASRGLTGVIEEKDYRGVNVLAAYTYITELEWGLVAKQDTREIFHPVTILAYQFILLFMGIAILIYLLASVIARAIARPVKEMSELSQKIQEGNYSQRVKEIGSDEVGQLAKMINRTAEAVQRATNVSNARTDMLENIIKVKDFRKFSGEIIRQLCDYTDSQLGAFFHLNQEKGRFEHLASIGLDRGLIKPFNLKNKEGLVGQVIEKKGIVYLKNIPVDTVFAYKTIAGNMIPREMIAFPLLFDAEVKAIIILASIYPYRPEVLEILSQSMTPITITLENLLAEEEAQQLSLEIRKRNKRLSKLTDELKEQAEELKNQKEELEHQNIELELQKNEVQEANRLKSEFLSNMSHELRTPLNSIIALSDILETQLGKSISEEQSQYLNVISRNGKHLLNLINDILDLSKIEAGKINVLPEYFSLEQILSHIKENFDYQAKNRGIKLKLDIQPNLPEIYSDRQKINQILQNLVSNAIKFTEKGSVTIKSNFDEKRERFIIRVIDTGIGIPEKDISTIFEEFKQVDGSVSRKYEGTGLGLSIVSRLVKKLGGEVQVKSQPGEGSTFSVLLPKEVSDYHTSSLLPPEDSKKEKEKKQAYTLLLVEDNESAISQIKFLLEDKGYYVAVAHGGEEALKYLQKNIPDGIILDLMMPEIDGFEVLKRLRKNEQTKDIPVLILTAKELTVEEITQLKDNGIQKLIFKGSIDRVELLRKIKSMLGVDTRRDNKEKEDVFDNTDTHLKGTRNTLKGNLLSEEIHAKDKILVGEDNEDNLLTLKAILEDNYHLIEATNGEELLKRIDLEIPDLILLDIGLPKVDGFEIIKRLKNNPKTRKIPIIAVTAMAMRGEREKILLAGSDDYIPKPIETSVLVNKVNQWLSKK